jgi:hypothetical protein
MTDLTDLQKQRDAVVRALEGLPTREQAHFSEMMDDAITSLRELNEATSALRTKVDNARTEVELNAINSEAMSLALEAVMFQQACDNILSQINDALKAVVVH